MKTPLMVPMENVADETFEQLKEQQQQSLASLYASLKKHNVSFYKFLLM